MLRKLTSFLIIFSLLFQQSGFSQVITPGSFPALSTLLPQDKFRPIHLRSISYDQVKDNLELWLDQGDFMKGLSSAMKGLSPSEASGTVPKEQLKSETTKIHNYFLIGLTLPNESFWVNLRPDGEERIIDPYLAQTDLGRVLLEADLQLKKDAALATSPKTKDGKTYWQSLYKKSAEIYGNEAVNSLPAVTRVWIVPDEVILRQAGGSAYVYKATLKVLLEEDYFKGKVQYTFSDPRQQALNEYSRDLYNQLFIPRLTKEINTAKRYANLRQVYYSLILAQWFKKKFNGKENQYSQRINTRNLTGLTSEKPWSKTKYFKDYLKSTQKGEYNVQEIINTADYSQVIRQYFSGGIVMPVANLTIIATNPEIPSPVVDPVNGAKDGIFSRIKKSLLGVIKDESGFIRIGKEEEAWPPAGQLAVMTEEDAQKIARQTIDKILAIGMSFDKWQEKYQLEQDLIMLGKALTPFLLDIVTKSENKEEKKIALGVLSNFDDEAALNTLITILTENPDTFELGGFAAKGIGRIGKVASPQVKALLTKQGPKRNILYAIEQLKDESFLPLLNSLKASDSQTKLLVANTMLSLGGKVGLIKVLELLETAADKKGEENPTEDVRMIVNSLPYDVKDKIRQIFEEDSLLENRLLSVIEKILNTATDDQNLQLNMISLLGAGRSEQTAKTLWGLYTRRGGDNALGRAVALSMKEVGTACVPFLIKGGIRNKLIYEILGDIEDASAVPYLLGELKRIGYDDYYLSQAVSGDIEKIGVKAIPYLSKELLKQEDNHEICQILKNINDPEAISTMIKALKTGISDANKINIVEAIGWAQFSVLEQALKKEPELRKILFDSTVNFIKKGLSGMSDFAVRRIIEQTATEADDSALADLYNNHGLEIKKAVIPALGKRGNDESIGFLINAAADSNSEIASEALAGLEQLGRMGKLYAYFEKNKSKEEQLVRILEANINSKVTIVSAIALLGYIGSEQCLNILINELNGQVKNNKVSTTILEALISIGEKASVTLQSQPETIKAIDKIVTEGLLAPLSSDINDEIYKTQLTTAFKKWLIFLGEKQASEPLKTKDEKISRYLDMGKQITGLIVKLKEQLSKNPDMGYDDLMAFIEKDLEGLSLTARVRFRIGVFKYLRDREKIQKINEMADQAGIKQGQNYSKTELLTDYEKGKLVQEMLGFLPESFELSFYADTIHIILDSNSYGHARYLQKKGSFSSDEYNNFLFQEKLIYQDSGGVYSSFYGKKVGGISLDGLVTFENRILFGERNGSTEIHEVQHRFFHGYAEDELRNNQAENQKKAKKLIEKINDGAGNREKLTAALIKHMASIVLFNFQNEMISKIADGNWIKDKDISQWFNFYTNWYKSDKSIFSIKAALETLDDTELREKIEEGVYVEAENILKGYKPLIDAIIKAKADLIVKEEGASHEEAVVKANEWVASYLQTIPADNFSRLNWLLSSFQTPNEPDLIRNEDSIDNTTGWGGGWFTQQLFEVGKLIDGGRMEEAKAKLNEVQGYMDELQVDINNPDIDDAYSKFEEKYKIDAMEDIASDLPYAVEMVQNLQKKLNEAPSPAPAQKKREEAFLRLNDPEERKKDVQKLLSGIQENYAAGHRSNQYGNASASYASYVIEKFAKELGITNIAFYEYLESPIAGVGFEKVSVRILGIDVGNVEMAEGSPINPNGTASEVIENAQIDEGKLEQILLALKEKISSRAKLTPAAPAQKADKTTNRAVNSEAIIKMLNSISNEEIASDVSKAVQITTANNEKDKNIITALSLITERYQEGMVLLEAGLPDDQLLAGLEQLRSEHWIPEDLFQALKKEGNEAWLSTIASKARQPVKDKIAELLGAQSPAAPAQKVIVEGNGAIAEGILVPHNIVSKELGSYEMLQQVYKKESGISKEEHTVLFRIFWEINRAKKQEELNRKGKNVEIPDLSLDLKNKIAENALNIVNESIGDNAMVNLTSFSVFPSILEIKEVLERYGPLTISEKKELFRIAQIVASDDSVKRGVKEINQYLKVFRLIKSLLKNKGRAKVLDLGCGPTGNARKELAEKYGEKIDVYGVDVVITAEERKSLYEADISDPEFMNNFSKKEFDLIYAKSVMGYLTKLEIEQAIPNILGILGPGGKFIFDVIEPEAFKDENHKLIKELGGEIYTDDLAKVTIMKKTAPAIEVATPLGVSAEAQVGSSVSADKMPVIDWVEGELLSSRFLEETREEIAEVISTNNFLKKTLGNIPGIEEFDIDNVRSISVEKINKKVLQNEVFKITAIDINQRAVSFVLKVPNPKLSGTEDSADILFDLNNRVPDFVPMLFAVNKNKRAWSEEYIEGKNLEELRGELESKESELRVIEEKVVETYFSFCQKTKGGIRDPHAGNFVVFKDNDGLQVKIIDTGMYRGTVRPFNEWIGSFARIGGFELETIFRGILKAEDGRKYLEENKNNLPPEGQKTLDEVFQENPYEAVASETVAPSRSDALLKTREISVKKLGRADNFLNKYSLKQGSTPAEILENEINDREKSGVVSIKYDDYGNKIATLQGADAELGRFMKTFLPPTRGSDVIKAVNFKDSDGKWVIFNFEPENEAALIEAHNSVAVFSDIHGDIDALKQLLGNAGNVKRIIFIGDFAGGENDYEVLQQLLKGSETRKMTLLYGGHDLKAEALVLGFKDDVDWLLQSQLGGLINSQLDDSGKELFDDWVYAQFTKGYSQGSEAEKEVIRLEKALIANIRSSNKLKTLFENVRQQFNLYNIEDIDGEKVFFVHAGLPVDPKGNLTLEFEGKNGLDGLIALQEAIKGDDKELKNKAYDYLLSEDSSILLGMGEIGLEQLDKEGLKRLLGQLGVDKIIVGHKPQKLENVVELLNRLKGDLFIADFGIGKSWDLRIKGGFFYSSGEPGAQIELVLILNSGKGEGNINAIVKSTALLVAEGSGTMGRWDYESATLATDGTLTLHNATRIPTKEGVVEEEFLIEGRNNPRDIVFHTRKLNEREQIKVSVSKKQLGIEIEFQVIVRDESSINNRIYGIAVQGMPFIREDIIAKGNDEQIKEALDHENKELSARSHDNIRGDQYQGDLRGLITELSDRDKTEKVLGYAITDSTFGAVIKARNYLQDPEDNFYGFITELQSKGFLQWEIKKLVDGFVIVSNNDELRKARSILEKYEVSLKKPSQKAIDNMERIKFNRTLTKDEQLELVAGARLINDGNGGVIIDPRTEEHQFGIIDTSLEEINSAFKGILGKPLYEYIRSLAQAKSKINEKLYVLEWGAGNLRAARELVEKLAKEGITNIQIIATGDTYDASTEIISDNITFILDTAENLPSAIKSIIKDDKIELGYSKDVLHFPLSDTVSSQNEFLQHIGSLSETLSEKGVIVFDMPVNKQSAVGNIKSSLQKMFKTVKLESNDKNTRFNMLLEASKPTVSLAKNQLDEAVKSSIESLLVNDKDRIQALEKLKNSGEITFAQYTSMLAKIGEEAGVTGGAVLYPFGGFDPLAGFGISKEVTDVISIGYEEFGPLEQLEDFLKNSSSDEKVGIQFSSVDYLPKSYVDNKEGKGQGVGLIVARLVSFLNADIKGINYFDINEDGSLRWADGSIKDMSYANAMIKFTDENGKEKQYWYISHNVYDGVFVGSLFKDKGLSQEEINSFEAALKNNGYLNTEGVIQEKILNIKKDVKFAGKFSNDILDALEKSYRNNLAFRNFMQNLKFQTLLIKAPMGMWNPGEMLGTAKPEEVGYNKKGFINNLNQNLLNPAINNKAVVISDAFDAGKPHNIWREGYKPHEFPLTESQKTGKQRFGYSGTGESVYYGNADGLKLPTSPAQEANKKVSGIDLRELPLGTVPLENQGMFPAGTVPSQEEYINQLNMEWSNIKEMMSSGKITCPLEISKYLQVSIDKNKPKDSIEEIFSCISQLLRMEEDLAVPTEPALKEFLVLLETGSHTQAPKKPVFEGTFSISPHYGVKLNSSNNSV